MPSPVCFTAGSFEQLVLKKDPVSTIFNFPMQAGNGTKRNNKQAHNTRRAASHLPSKIRFVFRSKTFPKNDALTQKTQQCTRQQSGASQSRVSLPFLPLKCTVSLETFLWSHRLSLYFQLLFTILFRYASHYGIIMHTSFLPTGQR